MSDEHNKTSVNITRVVGADTLRLLDPSNPRWQAEDVRAAILQVTGTIVGALNQIWNGPKAQPTNLQSLLEQIAIERYIPGQFKCPKCGMWFDSRLENGEKVPLDVFNPGSCPNDAVNLVQVTWREGAEHAGEIAGRHRQRVEALENAWPDGFAMPISDEFEMNTIEGEN